MESRSRLGAALVVAGVLLAALTVVAGSAFAGGDGAGASADPGSDAPTRTLLGVQGVGSYHDGGYVALLEGGERAWAEDSADTYFDVTRREDGTVLAAFMSGGYEDCGPYDAPCAHTGFRIIDPEPSPRVVTEWSFPVRSRTASEVHDVEPLPGGGVLVADMEHERVAVVENGSVAWEWRASSVYEAPDDPTRRDWLHINDVDRIGEGRFLVSVRNANQLLVVERGSGVVETINADEGGSDESCLQSGQLVDADGDGDVRCGDRSVLHHQHNPQWLDDGAVLVADSENHRVVELHREDGAWTPAWVLERAGGRALDWPRDADRLPDGTTLVTDTRNARLLVVNESGTVRREHRLNYRALPYDADRLPAGEPVGGPRYGDDADTADATAVPVLTPALRLASAAVRLPLWFEEPHLLSVLVSVFLSVAGLAVLARERLRQRRERR